MNIRIGTAEAGGTFDTQGAAIGELLRTQDGAESVEIVHSLNASVGNANRLHTGEIDLGFMAANWIGRALNGAAPFDHPISLRMAGPANAGPLFFVTQSGSSIETVRDVAGKRVCVGAKNSGMTQHVHTIFDVLGISFDDFLSFAEGADALVSGDVDVQFQCPIPNQVMTDLSERADVRVVDLVSSDLGLLLEAVPYYRRTVMRAGAFRGLNEDTPQVAVLNVVVSHESVPEDKVHAVIRAMADNTDALAAANPLYIGLGDLYEPLRSEGAAALEIGGVPLHPGAVRAYRELGYLT